MARRIFFISAVLFVVSSVALFYLNEVVFPTKIRNAIVEGVEKTTGMKVALVGVKFNIFRGIVMRDLIIYNEAGAMISAKEISASVMPLPVFRKEIIIPAVSLSDAELFIHRREDGSFNIVDAFLKDLQIKKVGAYHVSIAKININNGRINFRDDTVKPNFTRQIRELSLDARLSLPDKVKFDARFKLLSPDSAAVIEARGEYYAGTNELLCGVKAGALRMSDLSEYFAGTAFPSLDGMADGEASVSYKDDILSVDMKVGAKELKISSGRLKAVMDSGIIAKAEYAFKNKAIKYSGTLDVKGLTATGIDTIERLDGVKGLIEFTETRVWSDKIDAVMFGLPVVASFSINAAAKPILEVEINSILALSKLEEVLRNNFSMAIPGDLSGRGVLYLEMVSGYPISNTAKIEGYLDITEGVLKGKKDEYRLGNVTGRVEFNSNQISWSDLAFNYADTGYKSTGTLTNFTSPGVRLALTSKDLSVNTAFLVQDEVVTFSKLAGKYRGIDFDASGNIDMGEKAAGAGAFKGLVKMDIRGLKEIFKESGPVLDKARAAGRIEADFNISGKMKDLKTCALDTRLRSRELSIHGCKLKDVVVDYGQSRGAAEVRKLRASVYGGTLLAEAKFNMLSKGFPFSTNIIIDNMRIELLKTDTPFREKDLGGKVMVHLDLRGLAEDSATYDGMGRLKVSEGKLWELNLFRGIGQLLFTSDFSNILFKEGECNFFVRKNYVYTDEIYLKSDQLVLKGPLRVGLDNSVQATFKAEISDSVLLSETRKKITTAIEKYSIINISGTLKDPKFELRPNVVDIIKDVASALIKRMQE